VVVSPLRLILTFDLTRRQNNKKVTAVKMQILGTATVLFRCVSRILWPTTSPDPFLRLRDLHEEQVKGPDGMPLQDVVDLIQRIATDIQECASACDLYLNKSGFCTFFVATLDAYLSLLLIVSQNAPGQRLRGTLWGIHQKV
jgi:hypothetical protein